MNLFSALQMTNVHMSPPFKGHAVHKEFLSVERPSPEGAGSSAYDSHTAPWTGFAPGSLPTPLRHTLMRSKWSKDSLNGCREHNTIRSIGTQRHTGHLCKKCVSYFNIFKGEAFKQIIDGNLSTKVREMFSFPFTIKNNASHYNEILRSCRGNSGHMVPPFLP